MRRLAFFCLAIFFGCHSSEQTVNPLFNLLSEKHTGITFSNQLTNKKLNIIQYMYYYNGGGVAAGDFNNDGLVDIYFTANEQENRLYVNKGNFRFEDITHTAGVAGIGDWSTGVTLVDINNDGFLDIYVCQVGGYKNLEGHNLLFVNNGDLTFTEKSSEYGLDFRGFSTQAVFFDFDNDGDLDMYLLNHSVHTIHSYGSSTLRQQTNSASGDRLYRNLSEKGMLKFEDVTAASGIYSSHIGYGLGVSVSDINQDGWLDVYVANDFHENDYLYINNGNGTFTDRLEKLVAHTSRYSMGCDIADINGDGLADIVTLDMLPENPEILLKSASEDTQEVADIKLNYGYGAQYVRNCLQINRGDHFIELAQHAGMYATDWSWGALIGDFTNDGNAELFITTGIYKRPNDLDYIQYTADIANLRYQFINEDSLENEMINKLPTLRIPNYMYQQVGQLKFENRSSQWGLDAPSYSNGVTYADLDNDGDLDLIVNNVNQPAFIYENKSNIHFSNNYVKVELRSEKNYFGVGARLHVYAGGKVFMREMILSRGFQSAVAPVVHVGLGDINSIDSIEIFWRGNRFQVEKNIDVNSSVLIQERDDLIVKKSKSYFAQAILKTSPYSFIHQHIENDYKDYLAEPLIPYLLSREGPALAVADVNNDGLDDIFIGGAHGQPGALYVQKPGGSFRQASRDTFEKDKLYEDVDAEFVDVNGDGISDLYVASAGNEYAEGNYLLADRLYLNDGKGNFVRGTGLLPPLHFNSSCVRTADFNNDGYVDLFVGSRNVPFSYGLSPKSHVLVNDGNGKFSVHSELQPGMVTDAAWHDVNGDGLLDLIVLGDWMPISVYLNMDGRFVSGKLSGLDYTHGWWRSLKIFDVDGDHQSDIIAGNVGDNLKLKPSKERPLTLLVHDFDNNGTTDPILFYYLGNRNIPFQTKMQLGKQLPILNKKFTNYQRFSEIDGPQSLFTPEKLQEAVVRHSYTFKTSIFTRGGASNYNQLTIDESAQLSVVNDMLMRDFNDDGKVDFLMIGNTSNNTINLGAQMAQAAILLLGNTDGFKVIPVGFSDDDISFSTFNRVRSILIAGKNYIILSGSNQQVKLYSLELNP